MGITVDRHSQLALGVLSYVRLAVAGIAYSYYRGLC